MSFDYTIEDLRRISATDVTDSPPGEEGERLYMIQAAALEARIRLERARHKESLGFKV